MRRRQPSGRRRQAASLLMMMLLAACESSAPPAGGPAAREASAGPAAGTWRTWVLPAPDAITVPPPPSTASAAGQAELAELRRLAGQRNEGTGKQARFWSDYPANEPWVQLNLKLVSEQSKDPPRASRGYALTSVAIYDAVVAAWHWKYVYRRAAPTGIDQLVPAGTEPSYPDEHAVMAGAASRVLEYLFPEAPGIRIEELADQAAEARVAAGTNFRSDETAGLDLGRAVAGQVLARARADGSDQPWDGQRPRGPGYWEPPPGTAAAAVSPTAGRWRTWLVNPAELRPPPPPQYGGPQFLTEAREVDQTVAHLTSEQKRIASHWAAGAGTPLPPGMWNQIMLEQEIRPAHLSLPGVTRAFAALNVAEADAGIACWDAKYTYWSVRPINAIRETGINPTFAPFLPTPVFPSYVSGHSTYSGAAAEVLSRLFPHDAGTFARMAVEAAVSRLYAGIHYRSDNDAGLGLGKRVGQAVVESLRRDGADLG